MQHQFFSSVVAVALALFMGVSAAAQSGNNSRYYQFADTAAASVSSPASGRVRLFFDGTGFYWKNSAGVSTAVGGGGFTLTQYAIPMAATTTTLGDSKMIASGTNSGTWTLYDNTAVTGVSQLYVRDGAGQASSPQLVLGTNGAGVGLSIYARPSTPYVDFRDGNAGSYINIVANGLYGGSGGWGLEDSSNALVLSSGSKITWQSAANYYSGSPDIGLARSAAGILKVTNGSTGVGSFWAGGGTIYDDTATTGSTVLTLRAGAGQTNGVLEAYGDGVEVIGRSASNRFSAYMYGLSIGYPAIGAGELRVGTSTGTTAIYTNSVALSSGVKVRWSAGDATGVATDLALQRVGVGILAVTDDSTGQGGIGIADSATNTVSNALILRHQGGAVDGNGFGTAIQIEAENDGGVMHAMGRATMYWLQDDDTNEASFWQFYNYENGTEKGTLSFGRANGIDNLGSSTVLLVNAASNLQMNSDAGVVSVSTAGTNRYLWSSVGMYPAATNTYDIGTSSAVVREIFGRALTSDLNLFLGAGNVDQIVMGSTYFGTTGSAINTLNLGYVGAEFASAYVSTSIQGTREKTLGNDNALTNVTQISSAVSDRAVAGYIDYTVTVSDTTNHLVQMETASVPFLLVNENGTVTATIGTVYGSTKDNAGGAAITNTWSATVTGTNVMIEVTCDYDAATLTGTIVKTIQSRVHINSGTATVTPQ